MINHYPYTDLHELNLDWILSKIKEMRSELTEFEALNTITWHGEWNITDQYPQWSLVDVNGSGYISLQPVPVGIPITNSDYWVLVADYTAIIQYITDKVNEIEAEMSLLVNKKMICIGDSYLAYNSTEMETESWGAFLRIYTGLGADIVLNGLGGSGFIGNAAKTFQDLLEEVTVADNEAITDIIVLGGMNDAARVVDTATTEADILNAMNAFISSARTNYPNARIHIGFCGWMANGFANRDNYVPEFLPIINIYKNCVNADRTDKISYINGMEYVCAPQPVNRFKADLIHPLATLSSIIGQNLTEYLHSGKCLDNQIAYSAGQQTISASGVTASVAQSPDIKNIGDKLIVSGILGLSTNAGTEFGSAVFEYEVGECLTGPLRSTTANNITIDCNCIIFPGKGGTYDMIQAQLAVKNGKLYARHFFDTSLGNYQNITNVNYYIPTQEFNTLLGC